MSMTPSLKASSGLNHNNVSNRMSLGGDMLMTPPSLPVVRPGEPEDGDACADAVREP